MLSKLLCKISNLCEIATLPNGLQLKLHHRNFHWRDLRMCTRLKAAGVDPVTIFDVGANIGQFALGCSIVFPAAIIYSFEPVMAAYERLSHLAKLYPSIQPRHKALGAHQGKAKIRVTSSTQSSSFLPLHTNHILAYPDVKEERTEEVVVSTLTEEITDLRAPQPALLKLDTQGFESQVLRGAGENLRYFDWILLETSTKPMYQGEVLFAQICEILETKGFRFETPVEIQFTPEGSPAQFDALFTRDQRDVTRRDNHVRSGV